MSNELRKQGSARFRRFAGVCVAGTALMLSGCFFTPGQFDSTLTLHRDGSFAYRYTGEISIMGMTQMAKMDSPAEFLPECEDEESWEPRDCTPAEIRDQREEWEKQQAKDQREKEEFVKMVGGLDPSNPETARKLAETLERQKGWKSVSFRDEGIFDVDFEVSGTLSHAFQFPTMERMPTVSAFVAVIPRKDGSVRIDAPGFNPREQGSAFGPGLGMFSAMGAAKSGASPETEPVVPNGTFRIVTDGEILANNTDDGAESGNDGTRVLSWTIGTGTTSAPMALIQLDR